MSSCPARQDRFLDQHGPWRAEAVGASPSDAEATTDRVAAFAETHFVGPRRVLSLDLPRLSDPDRNLSSRDDGLQHIWNDIRRTLEIFPMPRHGNRRSVAAGLVREGIERQALVLFERHGIDEIVDRRLEADLDLVPAGPGVDDPDVLSFDTGWGGQRRPDGRDDARSSRIRVCLASLFGLVLLAMIVMSARLGSMLTFAGGTALAAMPLLHVRLNRRASSSGRPRPFGDERVKVGRGWIETASGRRRRRDEVITSVLRQSESDERIEVRIIGPNRVVRLRFESVTDHRFIEFWRRWSGFQTESTTSRIG